MLRKRTHSLLPDSHVLAWGGSATGKPDLPERVVLSAPSFDYDGPQMDIVAPCAACWLNARESKEKLDGSAQLLADSNRALKEAGLTYQGSAPHGRSGGRRGPDRL